MAHNLPWEKQPPYALLDFLPLDDIMRAVGPIEIEMVLQGLADK